MGPTRLRRFLIGGTACAAIALLGAAEADPIGSGAAGSPPVGWHFESPSAADVSATVVDEDCPRAEACVAFAPHGSVTGTEVLRRQLDASPYRGKRVRYHIEGRTEGAQYGNPLATSLTVLGAADRIEWFESSKRRGIFIDRWTPLDIVADVASDAQNLILDIEVPTGGRSWTAHPVLQVVGDAAPTRVDPPASLTARERVNLLALTRLLRIVRHFYAGDRAAATQWSSFTVNAVREVLPARDGADLERALERAFAPIAPTVRFAPASAPLPTVLPPPEATGLRWWVHHGFGEDRVATVYRDERITSPPGPIPLERVPLDTGIVADVPLAVAVDGRGTLPHLPPLSPMTSTDFSDLRDRAAHVAGVIDAWEVIDTFSPYLATGEEPWDDVLPRLLDEASRDADGHAYAATLGHLLHALRDGHGRVIARDARPGYAPLARLRRLAGRVVVVAAPASSRLRSGDVIDSVDGVPVADAWRHHEAVVSGSPQWLDWVVASRLVTAPAATPLALTVERSGARRHLTVGRSHSGFLEPRPATGSQLRPGILYVDLTRSTASDVRGLMPRLEAARGIIFDMRGYPTRSMPDETVLPHLSRVPLRSAFFEVPIIDRPGRVSRWDDSGRWTIGPKAPYLTAKRAFLIDGRAISYAESILGIVEAYRLGALVGERTAGTNGDVDTIPLPAGDAVVFTGMKVIKHDGSPHHLVGIAPTIPVTPTVQALAAGRDEQLEAAIRAVGG